jgi:hypothetical protein
VAGANGATYLLTTTDAGSTMRVAVKATGPSGSSSAVSAATSVVTAPTPPPPTTPPTNQALPTIAGIATAGSVLSASPGGWSGSPTSYSYQWLECNSSGDACANIDLATAATFALDAGQVGSTIRVVVTAANGAGSASALSAPTAVVETVTGSGTSENCTMTVDTTTELLSVNHTVNPGDVVCIVGTLTTSSNVFLTRSGTLDAPIVYRGGTIQYTGGSAPGGLLQVNGGTPWAGAHDIVFDGITLDGANLIGGGIFVSRGAHHVTVRKCTIKNMGAVGIAFNASDYVTAVDNHIYHVGYNQGWGSGISLWYGGHGGNIWGGATAWYGDTKNDLGFHNIIARNIVSGTYDNSNYHSDGNGFVIDGSGDIPPALFIGNVAFENGGRGFINMGNSGSVWFVNNTSYLNGLDLNVGSGQAPEMMTQWADETHWVNNIAFARQNTGSYTSGYLFNISLSTTYWSRDLAYNGVNTLVPTSVSSDPNQYRYVDPRFVNRPQPASGDLTPWANALAPWDLGDRLALTPGSPGADTGIDPLTAPGMTAALSIGLQRFLDIDLLEHPRRNGASIDIGAYES